jgi:two-component system sensor histidine kinase GlrK
MPIIYYPRSFSGLLILGFTLVAVPLVAALINNAVSINRLVNRSQLAVYQAVQATQNSRRLAELISALERNARQMLILGDRSLLDTYNINRKQFLEVTNAFVSLPFDHDQRLSLGEIVAGEKAIHAVLANVASKSGELQQALQRFGDLAERSRIMTLHSNDMIDREVAAMRATAAQAQRIIFWQMLALLPVVVFLAIGFAILITRPIRQIEAAIRDLGSGHLDKPVSVSGPVDLQFVGDRLDWMRRRLLEVDDQKNRFLRQVSHELKTPLTAVREGAELLSDGVVGKLVPAQREVAEILRHQSLKLQKLIEDLLSYSASHYQSATLAMTRVDMQQLVNRVAHDQKLALHARNLKLVVNVEAISVMGDFEKLRGLLDNLLSNAIKYSPNDGTIEIRAHQHDDQVDLTVIDEGPGIAPEDRAHVFEPFYQGRTAASGLVKGTGIGLSIVKDHAQAHGGSVEIVDNVDDSDKRGARLRVRLPVLNMQTPA